MVLNFATIEIGLVREIYNLGWDGLPICSCRAWAYSASPYPLLSRVAWFQCNRCLEDYSADESDTAGVYIGRSNLVYESVYFYFLYRSFKERGD